MSNPKEFGAAVYAKTLAGQQEIQTRSLGLAPLVRRLLVLVDGKRSAAELLAFVPAGQDVEHMFGELLALGCVEFRVKPRATEDDPDALASDDPAIRQRRHFGSW